MYLLLVVEKTRRCRKYPRSQSCFRSTSTSCGEKCVFCLPMHLSAIKVSADRQFWARAKLIGAPHIRRQDMGYYKGYVAKIWMAGQWVVALWKIYSQREKKTSPRMPSAPFGCLLSLCWAFADPPVLPGKNQPDAIMKLQEITPLSPYDCWHLPSSTGKVYLGLFKCFVLLMKLSLFI